MFISRFFAVAVAALASVSFVGAVPTAEKGVLVKRATEDSVFNTLSSLSTNLNGPIGLISSSWLLPPHCLTCTDITPSPQRRCRRQQQCIDDDCRWALQPNYHVAHRGEWAIDGPLPWLMERPRHYAD
jgi:hypothetical protein